ncbi:MAG: biotin transporter BioY [Eubacterium sp.]|nr:biotin transporter BioY [Eubacterium sp.]
MKIAKSETVISSKLTLMIMTALMAAVLCVVGPLSVPIGPVPISLTMLVLFFAVYILGTGYALISCVIYLLIGMIGLPVFSGYQGGLAKLAGPTGGYLIGFIPMIAVAGGVILLSGRFVSDTKKVSSLILLRVIHFAGFVVATAVLYFFGTLWFVISTRTPVISALGLCVFPFIPGDLIKIAVAVVLGPWLAQLIKASMGQR